MAGLILVIEDEPGIVDFLERGLTAHGFQVSSALDGERGLSGRWLEELLPFEPTGDQLRAFAQVDADLAVRATPGQLCQTRLVPGERHLGAVDEAQGMTVAGIEALAQDAPVAQRLRGQAERPRQVGGQGGFRFVQAQAQVGNADSHARTGPG